MTGKRRKTRTWEEEPGGWRFEVTHPDGHEASGSGLRSEKAAKDAAGSVSFEQRVMPQETFDDED